MLDKSLSLKLFVVLSKATKTITELVKDDVEKYNINPSEFSVLELLYFRGSHPIQSIGKRILLSSGSITYVIDKLETKGFIKRENCKNDRRIIHVSITEEGKQFFEGIFPKHEEVVELITGGLTPEEKEMSIRLLKKMGLYARKL